MRFINVIALSICFFTLTACQTWDGLKEDINSIQGPSSGWSPMSSSSSSNDQPPAELFAESGNCPRLEVVDELGNVLDFTDISDPYAYNLISRTRISQAENSCSFSGKTATVDVKLVFEGNTGPKSSGSATYSHPFFVAVTAPNGNILAKEVFNAAMSYGPGQTTATTRESLRQIIPIANENDGPRYKVLVGFQLTQDQLSYNRAIIAQQKAAAEAAAKAAAEAAKNPAAIQTQEFIGTQPAMPQEPDYPEYIGTQPASPAQQQQTIIVPPEDSGPIVIAPQ